MGSRLSEFAQEGSLHATLAYYIAQLCILIGILGMEIVQEESRHN